MSERSKGAVLITGASRGLGRAMALEIASRGFSVWAGVRSAEAGAEVETEARRQGLNLRTVLLDVTEEASVKAACQAIQSSEGTLFALVNNAGMTGRAFFEDYPEDVIRRIFEVNLFGMMRVTRNALPLIRANRGGRIINISSIGGRIGSNSVTPYVASKFALEGFSESLSLEMAPFDIRVSIISPGIVNTDIWDESNRILPQARNPDSPYYQYFWHMERYAEKLLRSSRLTPEDVARKVADVLTERRPALRYVVGRRAAIVAFLRKHSPDRLFDALYFGQIRRLMIAVKKSGG